VRAGELAGNQFSAQGQVQHRPCAAQGGGHGSVLRTTHASQLNGKTAAAAAGVRSAHPPNFWQRGESKQKELFWKLC